MSSYRQSHHFNIGGATFGVQEFWLKTDGDGAAYLWKHGDAWYDSDNLGPTISIGDEAWAGSWNLYNGERYFTDGTRYLWLDTTHGWVITSRLGACTDERLQQATITGPTGEGLYCLYDDYTNAALGSYPTYAAANAAAFAYQQYVGDEWWQAKTDPVVPGTWVFKARGSLRPLVYVDPDPSDISLTTALGAEASAPVTTDTTTIYIAQAGVWL